MCIHQAKYDKWKKIYDDAAEDLKTCKEAKDYFTSWQGKVNKCKSDVESMASTIATISNGCAQIKINGKRFDEGKNYPNGSAEDFSKKIKGYKDSLNNISGNIATAISDLNSEINKLSRTKDGADLVLSKTPTPPCGKCSECKAAAGTSTRTTGTGSGDSGNSGSSGGSGGSGSSGGGARSTAATR